MNATYPWIALQTKPKSEKKVEYSLNQKGYECFLPTYRQKRRWSDRVTVIDLPLFPMYVFCRFNHLALGKAVSTPGVTRIVGFCGRPAEVEAKEIEALQLLVQSSLLREPWQHIPTGTLIRVETGPLAGVQGVFCSVDMKQRFVISVSLLQRSVAVQLDEDTAVSVIDEPKKNEATFCKESHLAFNLFRQR